MIKLNYYCKTALVKDPIFATSGSACFDLRAYFGPDSRKITIYTPSNEKIHRHCQKESVEGEFSLSLGPNERAMIPTGLIMDIPRGYSVRIHTRSGTAAKKGLGMSVSEGIIDSDYVEEVFVPMVNNTDKIFYIRNGERVAQCELVKNLSTDFTEIDEAPKEKTNRQGGFGSTGVE
jgi:dUTP pyrophosphatase